jgi:transcription elongation factor S-II
MKSTKLGVVVGRLRTHEDKKVADLAKDTVRKWKDDVAAAKKPDSSKAANATANAGAAGAVAVSGAGNSGPASIARKASVVDTSSSASAPSVKQANASAPSQKVRDAKTDGISKEITRDKVRDSSIILLYNAIVLDSTECKVPLVTDPDLDSLYSYSFCHNLPRVTNSQAIKFRQSPKCYLSNQSSLIVFEP